MCSKCKARTHTHKRAQPHLLPAEKSSSSQGFTGDFSVGGVLKQAGAEKGDRERFSRPYDPSPAKQGKAFQHLGHGHVLQDS